MKVVIVNDTAVRPHFGCELVMQTYREQLKRVDIELIKTIPKGRAIQIPDSTDMVLVNGEGTLHDGRRHDFINIAKKYPSILLNSVWQNNPDYEALKDFKYIAVRESFSLSQLPNNLSNVEVIPDIIFSSNVVNQFKRKFSGTTITTGVGITDNVTDKSNKYGDIPAGQPATEMMTTLCKYESLCIGRFHGVVLAAMLGIPFVAWQSNTHKIIGMLTDMKVPHLHFDNRTQAIDNIVSDFDDRILEYVINAKYSIDNMFEKIHNL